MKIQIPDKQGFLFKPARYKILHGGRGSSKSWGVARALLIRGVQEPLLILCAREIQSSIDDSVMSLLSSQVKALGLDTFYEVQKSTIIGANGTRFIFAGLRHNISKIKSAEAVDICWVEEAATVSKTSWDVLIPTIRKNGSEIWVTFNPELDTDDTYRRFILDDDPDSAVVEMNWRDNPWFPETLLKEKDKLQVKDYDAYLNVWEGKCRQTIDGAVYAKELRNALLEGRITKVRLLPGKPVDTFWDLGKRDHTSVWFVQFAQGEYRVVDFYQNRGEELAHYFKVLQERSYLYGMHFLPHDASADRLGSVAIDKQFKAIYPEKVKVLPRIANIGAGIEAVRELFPLCYFDEVKCADGLQALRRYKYDVDPVTGGYSKYPLHDENSDACDALRQIAQSMNMHKPKAAQKTVTISRHGLSSAGGGWMGG